MPGAHKIGAAISGPRITGGNSMDITFFLITGRNSTKKLCDRDFAERSGELSGATCLKNPCFIGY